MKHYGDITKIHGDAVEIVDIITGGSPCQDLSVAGKRDGLAGERSGLFMEQVRIVKEMRTHDVRTNGRAGQFIRPRYMVWENVPGAFSSNGGKDFQAVLTEIARIAEPECPDVPMPEKNKWRKSGCIYDGMGQWSVAWRVHDAQFWGVPQRRKRIALVADLGGLTAPEILFERKGLSRDSEQGEEERQGTSADAEGSTGTAISFQERAGCAGGGKGILIQNEHTGALSTLNNQSVMCLNDMGGRQMAISEDKTASLRAEAHWHQPLVFGIGAYNSEGMKSQNPNSGIYKADTARTLDLNGGSPACNQGGMAVLMDAFQHHGYRESDTCGTLTAEQNQSIRGDTPIVLEVNGTLQSKATGGWNCNSNMICRLGPVARRLTPLECERLQGYPDGWTDIGEWVDIKGKRHKDADSPRYKALGNSIALPFWAWMARRICAQYERPMTMASLFDGIGGFPLVFSRAGCAPVWASEIKEFPIAVTKRRFGK